MLCFRVDYLSGRVYAARDKQNIKLEFPPDPARLYSAFVAAAYENGDVGEHEKIAGEVRDALEWLEQQDSPCLYAAELPVDDDDRQVGRNGGTGYVPINTAKMKKEKGKWIVESCYLPSRRNRQPRRFRSATLSEPTVYFIYPNAEANGHRSVLEMLANRIARLGTAASFVSVTLCDAPPEPTHLPDEHGSHLFRVPSRGRLTALEEHYKQHDTQKSPPDARWVYSLWV